MNEPISLEYYNSLSEEQKDIIFRNWKQQGITIYNSTPDLWDNDSNRSTGRTTRLVDHYIQELFNNPNKEIEIIDHNNTRQSNIHLTQMILKRMYEEHRGVKIKVVNQNILKYVR